MRTKLTPVGARAYEALALADRFEYPGVHLSDQVCAVQALLREPHGAAAFQALLEEPSLVAKLYGLVGIWHREPGSFLERVIALDESWGDTVVATQSGCTVDRPTVRESLYRDGFQIAPGTASADIIYPSDGFRIDLAGGAIPALLGYGGCKVRTFAPASAATLHAE
jgi:hypothetical protein